MSNQAPVSTVAVERPPSPTPANSISPRRSARLLAFDADDPPANAARGAAPSAAGDDGTGAATMKPLVGEAAQAGKAKRLSTASASAAPATAATAVAHGVGRPPEAPRTAAVGTDVEERVGRRGTMLMALPEGSCGHRRHNGGEPLRPA